MRIAFFSDSFLPHLSGVTISLVNYTSFLVSQGHQVLIFAPKPAKLSFKSYKPAELDKRVKIEWLPSIRSFYPDLRIGAPTPRSFIKLKNFVPDLIHVYTPFLVGGEGVIGARLLKKPLIYSFHTYYMSSETLKIFGIEKKIKLVEKALWTYERNFAKTAKIIIAPTKTVAQDLKRNQFKNKIEILPSGIDLTLCKKDEQKKKLLKRKLDLSGQIILGVGRLSREKNWDFLLSAFKLLYDWGYRYTLVLIGKGPAEEYLRFLTRILRIEHRVRFLGAISYYNLIKDGYYNLGDVFAMPSCWETQGMVTLEAMAFGLPIVALKSKGTIDLVGKSGLLVSKNEKEFALALLKILKNQKIAQQLSSKSLTRAKDFCLKKLGKRLLEIYQAVLNST